MPVLGNIYNDNGAGKQFLYECDKRTFGEIDEGAPFVYLCAGGELLLLKKVKNDSGKFGGADDNGVGWVFTDDTEVYQLQGE